MTVAKKGVCFAALLLIFCVFCISTATAAPSLEEVNKLTRIYGDGEEAHQPALPNVGELRVYWFWSATSQCSRRAEPAIESLLEAFPGAELVVVHSNADENVAQAQRVAGERGLSFSIYRDEGAHLAVALDARMTPEVVVLDAEGVVYKGRPVAVRRNQIESYVEAALLAWYEGEAVEPAYRRPSGCMIRRP